MILSFAGAFWETSMLFFWHLSNSASSILGLFKTSSIEFSPQVSKIWDSPATYLPGLTTVKEELVWLQDWILLFAALSGILPSMIRSLLICLRSFLTTGLSSSPTSRTLPHQTPLSSLKICRFSIRISSN